MENKLFLMRLRFRISNFVCWKPYALDIRHSSMLNQRQAATSIATRHIETDKLIVGPRPSEREPFRWVDPCASRTFIPPTPFPPIPSPHTTQHWHRTSLIRPNNISGQWLYLADTLAMSQRSAPGNDEPHTKRHENCRYNDFMIIWKRFAGL